MLHFLIASCCEDRNGFYPRDAAMRHGTTRQCDIIVENLDGTQLRMPSTAVYNEKH